MFMRSDRLVKQSTFTFHCDCPKCVGRTQSLKAKTAPNDDGSSIIGGDGRLIARRSKAQIPVLEKQY
jgi:hypothetical protein